MHVRVKKIRSATFVAAMALVSTLAARPASADTVAAGYTLTTLVNFNTTNGGRPVGDLVLSGGTLYGATNRGGGSGVGLIYSYGIASNSFSAVATFNGTTTGGNPAAGLTAAPNGNFYGTTAGGGTGGVGTVYGFNPGSSTLTTVASFTTAAGTFPSSTAISDAAGNLYGTAVSGGTSDRGTVFKVDAASNAVTAIANFNNTNGSGPNGGLVFDTAGNLYGTTVGGGSGGLNGTVFKVAAGTNTLSTIATFNNTNGAFPQDSLTIDASGNLYGITNRGGTSNLGTIFKIDAVTNALTTLASFSSANGGGVPTGGITLDAQGNLFGTTAGIGSGTAFGSIYRLDAATSTLATVATFTGPNAGPGLATPNGRLLIAADGKIYGTTQRGGTGGQGTLFALAVPEPASLSLLITGGVALLHRRRNNA